MHDLQPQSSGPAESPRPGEESYLADPLPATVESTTRDTGQPAGTSTEPVLLTWDQHYTFDGQVYFVERSSGSESWIDPFRGIPQLGPLPSDWEIRWDRDGIPCFFHTQSKSVTHCDPRTTPADEAGLGPLPDGWKMMCILGRPIYWSSSVRKATPWDPRIFNTMLPPGWERRYDHDAGSDYFVDHNRHATSWQHPVPQDILLATPLPAGWEARGTPEGRVYYVNHDTQATSWDDPRDFFTACAASGEDAVWPSNWLLRWAQNGSPFFIDSTTGSTKWSVPQKDHVSVGWPFDDQLPDGWTVHHTPEGRIFFSNPSLQSWSDPRYRPFPEISIPTATSGYDANIYTSDDGPAAAVSRTGTVERKPVGRPSVQIRNPSGDVASGANDDVSLVASRMATITVNDADDDSDVESEPEGESDAPAFDYSPIESATRIRVLDIQPSTKYDEPIACTIRHVDLNSKPLFEALSYTWGSPKNQSEILLNSQPFRVMENAMAVLRRLRRPEKVRTIWMDAICINQSDMSEKSGQLPLMTRIYKEAQQVVVWLGELTDGALIGMKSLNEGRFKGSVATSWQTWKTHRRHGGLLLPTSDRLKAITTAPEEGTRVFELENGEVRELLNRSWWERVWIMQEAIVARHIVIMCGPEVATWDGIQHAIDKSKFKKLQTTSVFDLQKSHGSFLFEDKYRTVNEFRGQWASGSFQVPVYKLLYDFRGLFCSNARDRIFGFLGLTSLSSNPDFKPNYKTRVRKAYRQFATSIIKHTGTLDILNCVREWRGVQIKVPPPLVFSMIDQARFYDIRGFVTDGPGKKPRMSWVRLPPGWERVQKTKDTSNFVNRHTGEEQTTSPIANLPPAAPQDAEQQRILPDGWTKTPDNLGRPQVEFNPNQNAYSQPPKLAKDLAKLPSWVVNWANKTHIDPAPLLDWSDTEPLYNAGSRLGSAAIYTDLNRRALVVDGIPFDYITHLAEPWHPTSETYDISRRLLAAMETWEALGLADLAPSCPYGSGEGRKEALWRTHIADYIGAKAAPASVGWAVECWYDHDGWAKPLPADPPHSIRQSWSQNTEKDKIRDEMQDYVYNFYETKKGKPTDAELAAMRIRDTIKATYKAVFHPRKEYGETVRRIYRVCAHRRLFVTARGYLGLAPWNAKEGDAVYVLEGGKTPFILRGDGSGKEYTLVGEAFVYGIMAGEAVDLCPHFRRVRIV